MSEPCKHRAEFTEFTGVNAFGSLVNPICTACREQQEAVQAQVAAAVLQEHRNHVEFANDMYFTLIDPLAEGKMTEAEIFAACRKAAIEQREQIHNFPAFVAAAIESMRIRLLVWFDKFRKNTDIPVEMLPHQAADMTWKYLRSCVAEGQFADPDALARSNRAAEAKGLERVESVILAWAHEGDRDSTKLGYPTEIADELIARIRALKDKP